MRKRWPLIALAAVLAAGVYLWIPKGIQDYEHLYVIREAPPPGEKSIPVDGSDMNAKAPTLATAFREASINSRGDIGHAKEIAAARTYLDHTYGPEAWRTGYLEFEGNTFRVMISTA